MEVLKRNGIKKELFDSTKIYKAINEANKATVKEKRITPEQIQELVSWVEKKLPKKDLVEVEEIQDLVEEAFVHKNHTELFRNFRDYRKQAEKNRFLKFDVVQEMEKKFKCSDNQRQNANIDENSYGGRLGEASSAYNKKFALDYMISEKFSKNHKNFEGYIHDLDKYKIGEPNCLSVPFDDLLSNSVTVKTKNDIRSAGSISTAGQLIVVYFQTQSMNQFGGVSATHIDWTFVPFVRKSFYKYYKKHACRILNIDDIDYSFNNNMSIEDEDYKVYCKQAYDWAMEDTKAEALQTMESMLHNLNTLTSRSGNQLPFTSICYGRCTLPEGKLIVNALLDAWEEGIGVNHLTPIFPCGIFQVKKGINDKPGTPNYDLKQRVLKIVDHRIYPNFSNGDWSVQAKAFEKSQALKKEVLEEIAKNDPEFFEKIANLPKNIQETLGFTIEK